MHLTDVPFFIFQKPFKEYECIHSALHFNKWLHRPCKIIAWLAVKPIHVSPRPFTTSRPCAAYIIWYQIRPSRHLHSTLPATVNTLIWNFPLSRRERSSCSYVLHGYNGQFRQFDNLSMFVVPTNILFATSFDVDVSNRMGWQPPFTDQCFPSQKAFVLRSLNNCTSCFVCAPMHLTFDCVENGLLCHPLDGLWIILIFYARLTEAYVFMVALASGMWTKSLLSFIMGIRTQWSDHLLQNSVSTI